MESLESFGSLVPRGLNTCTGTKQWYVCTAGNFRGCCSSDPCTTGICPDDGDDTLSLTTAGVIDLLPSVTPRTTTASSTSTLSEATTLSTDASSAAFITSTTSAGSDTPTASETPPVSETLISQVSTSSDTILTTEPTGDTALSSVLAASTSPSSTPSNKPSAASSNKGAIIGGAVGGVAVLVICAILLFFCCRCKRKYGKREKGPTLASWYRHGIMRKDRATASEMKGPLSPSDSEAHSEQTRPTPNWPLRQHNISLTPDIALAIDSSSAGSPFTTDTTRGNIILTPDLAVGSSATSLISHSPHKTSPVPPAQPHSNELFASVPPRQGFTPELPDTGFHRLRAELASHFQSELINVPIEQRQRQQNHIRSRTGPRAWESPSLASIPSSRASPARGNNSSGQSHSNSNGGSPGRNQGGRVVTADGVVLGANLDRYSNGMAIGESLAEGERGRRAERGETDHVMSFMQYGGRLEDRGLRNGLGIASDRAYNPRAREDNVSRSRPRPAQRSLEDEIAAAEGDVDVPPAYEAEEVVPGHDIKSPSGRMGMIWF